MLYREFHQLREQMFPNNRWFFFCFFLTEIKQQLRGFFFLPVLAISCSDRRRSKLISAKSPFCSGLQLLPIDMHVSDGRTKCAATNGPTLGDISLMIHTPARALFSCKPAGSLCSTQRRGHKRASSAISAALFIPN